MKLQAWGQKPIIMMLYEVFETIPNEGDRVFVGRGAQFMTIVDYY